MLDGIKQLILVGHAAVNLITTVALFHVCPQCTESVAFSTLCRKLDLSRYALPIRAQSVCVIESGTVRLMISHISSSSKDTIDSIVNH